MTEPTGPQHVRSRTFSWHDPAELAAAGRTMGGLEFLSRMGSGELPPPPIVSLFGMTVRRVEVGEVEFGCPTDESVYNPIGTVHGGLVCTLLDTVTGCAVHSTLPAGVGYTSVEIKINYLRPVRGGVELIATGRVVKPGRRIAFADGEVRDAAGLLLATATATCLVIEPPSR